MRLDRSVLTGGVACGALVSLALGCVAEESGELALGHTRAALGQALSPESEPNDELQGATPIGARRRGPRRFVPAR